MKDGDTRNLRLTLTDVGGLTLAGDSWIQLNTSSQTLYGLPLDVDAGSHRYLLAAFNRRNYSVTTPLEVCSALMFHHHLQKQRVFINGSII